MKQEHSPNSILYDNVREGEIMLSPEEAELYTKQVKALSVLLSNKAVVAKYKIEVMFGKSRSMQRPTPGILSLWVSGSKLHGGGDDKLYLCPGRRLNRNNCEALLLESYNTNRGIVCPACGSIWKHEEVIGELLMNLSMRNWASVIYKFYRVCEYNADIYLKYSRDDIRTVAKAQSEKATWKGSQALERTREHRARQLYPLRNIIKDTSAGADLLSRFYAFLVS